MMTTLQAVAGYDGGPTIGTNYFESEILRNGVVHFIIVNNVPENGLLPDPDYQFQPCRGRIQRNNNWQPSDKMIVVYSKCNN